MTIILAIDQSTRASGWHLSRDGRTVESGVATNARERRSAVLAAFELALSTDDAVIAVLEDHRSFAFSRGNMSTKSLLGMGAARGRWEQELESHSIKDVRHVEPKVWRKAVLGLGANTPKERCKETARLYAKAVSGKDMDDDEAEALCIGAYAAKNFAPRKRRKAKKAC